MPATGYFVCRSDAQRWPAEGVGAKFKKLKKTRRNRIRVSHGSVAESIRKKQDGPVSVALLELSLGVSKAPEEMI